MRDDDLRAELQFHIDMRTQRHVNAGMAPEEAEALARTQFGDMEMLAPTGPVVLPQLPEIPRQVKIQKRPPPPPPDPTWEEFVAKVNTFGGVAPKRAR